MSVVKLLLVLGVAGYAAYFVLSNVRPIVTIMAAFVTVTGLLTVRLWRYATTGH